MSNNRKEKRVIYFYIAYRIVRKFILFLIYSPRFLFYKQNSSQRFLMPFSYNILFSFNLKNFKTVVTASELGMLLATSGTREECDSKAEYMENTEDAN